MARVGASLENRHVRTRPPQTQTQRQTRKATANNFHRSRLRHFQTLLLFTGCSRGWKKIRASKSVRLFQQGE
jgi:hypothetical protein